MITLACIGHSFRYELEHIVRLFYPGEKVEIVTALPEPQGENLIVTEAVEKAGVFYPEISVKLDGFTAGSGLIAGADEGNKASVRQFYSLDNELERYFAALLFKLLQKATGLTPPWGILTGVRPVRLYRQWREQGLTEEQAIQRFRQDYFAQQQKIDLAVSTAKVQDKILVANTPDSYSLYISIPFCPTRCLYCSFVSHDIEKAAKLMPDYIKLLRQELEETAKITNRLGLRLHTVYMGGGTPTSLSAKELEQVLAAVEEHFDLSTLLEYTVEAGRADTITGEKLDVLRKFGVNRISINPQTMDDTILRNIGRSHTAEQVLESYALAREKGFDAINMDLIAGLPGESPETFAATLAQILSLRPENITLHTLTVKRSSSLREQADAYTQRPYELNNMLRTAQERFTKEAYAPYYLYRQKGTLQNLENTGFSLKGFEGIYNVYSMEEVHTILAVGAGAVSKLCSAGDIQRIFNLKYPYEYIGRFSEIIERKTAVEAFYERHFGEKIHTC